MDKQTATFLQIHLLWESSLFISIASFLLFSSVITMGIVNYTYTFTQSVYTQKKTINLCMNIFFACVQKCVQQVLAYYNYQNSKRAYICGPLSLGKLQKIL